MKKKKLKRKNDAIFERKNAKLHNSTSLLDYEFLLKLEFEVSQLKCSFTLVILGGSSSSSIRPPRGNKGLLHCC